MKTDNKIIQYQKGLQPIAFLCVLLILLTSHPVMLAAVMAWSASTPPTAAVSTEQQVPLEASLTNAPIISLGKIDQGPGTGQNLLGCIVVLVGIGVGTYYGMKYLCRQAGLIPTNVPPPPPTNPPPPPPPTNRPPTWTNGPGGPLTITSTGGYKMYSLMNESSIMPPEVHAALMAGTSPFNPLFKTETEGPGGTTFHGVASMDASDFNVRYGPGYSDPAGNAYSNCLRYVIQAGHTLANGTTNWQTRMTMYVWVNDAYTCFSIYDVNKVHRENVVVSRNSLGNGPPVVIGSFDYVITHWYNPSAQGFFRTWSGVAPAVP